MGGRLWDWTAGAEEPVSAGSAFGPPKDEVCAGVAATGRLRMGDRDIRRAFHQKCLRAWHRSGKAVVVDELALQNGSARADIVVVNGKLNAFEIKSEGDSLDRLSAQAIAYNAVFDQISILVAPRHLEGARTLIPSWWGITVCVASGREEVRFRPLRKPAQNVDRDPLAIAQLLWREEAVFILRRHGVQVPRRSMTRAFLHGQLCESLDLKSLSAAVRMCLKRRVGWRDHAPPSRCDDSCRPIATSSGSPV